MTSRSSPETRAPILVASEQDLERLIGALDASPRTAIDIEANSFHAYYEKVCLIQIATDDGEWILDPLAVDARGLAGLFSDEKREVVFHAGEFDVLSLKRDYGFEFRALFDTQIAAMLLGMGQVSYAGLVEDLCEVHLRKGQQRSDWGRRPLTSRQLEYAVDDVRYLLSLRDELGRMLAERGLEKEAEAAFTRLASARPRKKVFDPEGYRRVKGYRVLDPVGMSAARALFLAREEKAQELDRPPFRIFGNDVLIKLAVERPADEKALSRIKGLPAVTLQRSAKLIVSTIAAAASEAGPPDEPRRRRSRRALGTEELGLAGEKRFQRLRSWRNRLAEERGIEGQVIARNELLRTIARASPTSIEELRSLLGRESWVAESYGDEIIATLGHGS